jgi:acetate kinase
VIRSVLALNAGSSTLKFSVYQFDDAGERELLSDTLRVEDGNDAALLEQVLERVTTTLHGLPDCVGHRIVHGGDSFTSPTRVDASVLQRLSALADLAPLHLPPALALLRLALSRLPGRPHVVCFDTAFHRTLPDVARRFAVSNELFENGIRRYGFHGLSCEYVLSALGSPPPPRLIVLHLGSGASVTAIQHGRSLDTTMGLTPTGGIPMGTRSGDLDPGVLIRLIRDRDYSADQLEHLLNHDSGLKGIAGSADMVQLLTRVQSGDQLAVAAIQLFAYAVKKQIGAYMAALGGLDCLVFTGGIGEHAPLIRELALSGLGPVGIELDAGLNQGNAPLISSSSSTVQVRVIQTNEDLVIARASDAIARSLEA